MNKKELQELTNFIASKNKDITVTYKIINFHQSQLKSLGSQLKHHQLPHFGLHNTYYVKPLLYCSYVK